MMGAWDLIKVTVRRLGCVYFLEAARYVTDNHLYTRVSRREASFSMVVNRLAMTSCMPVYPLCKICLLNRLSSSTSCYAPSWLLLALKRRKTLRKKFSSPNRDEPECKRAQAGASELYGMPYL
jgi:hypothetical protein